VAFAFYKAMGDLEAITEKWAHEDIVCSVDSENLFCGKFSF